LKTGGLLRKIFNELQKMLGPLRLINRSMLEPLTLQELSKRWCKKKKPLQLQLESIQN
jgi:hypothetical protein